AEPVALADGMVAAAAVVGAAEVVARLGPAAPVGAAVRIADRAGSGATCVGRMAEPVTAADRETAAAAAGTAEVGAGLRPAATVGAAVGVVGRADAPAAAVWRVEDALPVDALLARGARVRVVAGVGAGAARGEASGHHVLPAARANPSLVEGGGAAVVVRAADALTLPDELLVERLSLVAAPEERAAAVVRARGRRGDSQEECREHEHTEHERHPSPLRRIQHFGTEYMQRACRAWRRAVSSHHAQ